MSSCAASCCTCFRKASCAFATSDSSPTAPRSCHFAFICSAQHSRQSKTYPAAKTRVIFGSAQNVVHRCRSSRGLLLSRSNSVLHLSWSLLPHESTLYSTKPLRVPARSVSLRLVLLQISSFHFLQLSLRKNSAPTSLFPPSLPAALLSHTVPANLGTAPSHNSICIGPASAAITGGFLLTALSNAR